MKRNALTFLAVIFASLSGLFALAQVSNTFTNVATDFRTNGKFVNYAVVQRTNDNHTRRFWISREAIEALKAGKPIPSGSQVLMEGYNHAENRPFRTTFMVEKRNGWSAGGVSDPKERNGNWRYATLDAQTMRVSIGDEAYCHACHIGNERGEEYLYSMNELLLFARTGQVQQSECDQPGRTPCRRPPIK